MKITFSVRDIVYLAIFLAIFVFILSARRSYRTEIDRLNSALFSQSDTLSSYTSVINNQKMTISSYDAQVVSSQREIKRLRDEREYFEKLHINDLKNISKLSLEVDVWRKKGVYRDTVVADTTAFNPVTFATIFSDGRNPADSVRYVSWSDKWAWAQVMLYPDNPLVSLGLYESPMKVYVYYKGVLKPKPMASITSENPYITIKSASTVIVEEKKKFWQKKYPYAIAGLLGGYLIFK